MGLKQIKPKDRIIFLTKFMSELMNNSIESDKRQKKIEIQKLKQKFVEPLAPPEKTLKTMGGTEIFMPSKYSKPHEPHKPQIKETKREQPLHRIKIPKKSLIQRIRKPIRTFRQRQPKSIKQIQTKQQPQKSQIPQRMQVLTEIKPQAQPRPEGFNLGELETLLKDPSIQLIECPGPGKNLLIKRHNQVNLTKLNLNQAEITNLINNFANEAKIPIVGGILKAAVGDLVISAVISEFIGSRFIINKITPYSLIEK